uniref:Threonine synthase-like 2 isoform X3 n=1 Tax=Petromyzon marinus TaxID=7757 RepID=A0AAJ7WQF9_PETMA|nr:threonine synthase-like 2 isoform X3 [Petromyzon marinus]
MKYVSTRGAAAGSSFREALFSGYAVDGGLFMPEEVPRVSADTLRQWRALSYPQLVQNICSLYISPDEIPVQELGALIERALSRFAHSEVVTFKRLRDGLNVLELFHGPTMAFKDLAMCCLAQFILYFLQKEDKHVTIVVGTSGDTGGSAIASLRGAKRADVVVLLPAGRCSRVQELHMTTAMEENVHVFTVEGSSDDLDEPIRRLFADSEFSSRHGVISINSINWGRVLVQVAHHFYAYFRCTDGGGGGGGAEVEEEEMPTVEVVVPTGAAGNAAAGCVARRMGLPIRLLCAVNQNDVVHRALRSGDFSVDGAVKPSLASAIDIQVPYNMERVFHLCSDADTALVRDVMTRFYESGQANLPATLQTRTGSALRRPRPPSSRRWLSASAFASRSTPRSQRCAASPSAASPCAAATTGTRCSATQWHASPAGARRPPPKRNVDARTTARTTARTAARTTARTTARSARKLRLATYGAEEVFSMHTCTAVISVC